MGSTLINSGTIHSFAFAWAKNIFDIKNLTTQLNSRIIINFAGCNEIKHFSQYKEASILRNVISQFCNSSADLISSEHIPYQHASYQFDEPIIKKHEKYIISTAQKVWQSMIDANSEVPLGHDGYLKLWSLSGSKINSDFLLVDEAQDLSPVMIEIINNFSRQKVIVGDSSQQIYEWRGAANAMEILTGYNDAYLTESFRLGLKNCELANNILGRLKVKQKIVGQDCQLKIVSTNAHDNPSAILFRKNASLVEGARKIYNSNLKFFINDPNNNILSAIDDYFRLKQGQWGKSTMFQGFNSWESVLEYEKAIQEASSFSSFVDLLKSNNPELLRKIILSSEKKQGDYPTLSTIHQAKGMEWQVVQIDRDIADSLSEKMSDEALRLIYVAITRAKDTLCLPSTLYNYCMKTPECRSSASGKIRKADDKFAIIDIETTGLKPGYDRIIEVGVVIVKGGNIVDRFQSLINPQMMISSWIEEHTGITNKMVQGQPLIEEVMPELFAFIYGSCLVAHNANFDSGFLNFEFKKHLNASFPFACTLLLSRRVFPNLSSYKLESLVEELGLQKGRSHRALSDAEMTAHLFMKILEKLSKNTQLSFSAENLLKLQKIQPARVRKNGLQKIANHINKEYSGVRSARVEISGQRKAKKAVEYNASTTRQDMKPTIVSVKTKPSSSWISKLVTFIRRSLLTLNFIFWGSGVLVTFDDSILLSGVLFAFGYLFGKIISKIFRKR